MSYGIYTQSLLINEDFLNYAYVETLTPAVEKTNSKNGTYVVSFNLKSASDIFMILPSPIYAAVIYRNGTTVKLLTTGTTLQVQVFSVDAPTLYPGTYGLRVYNKDAKLIFTSQAAYLECYNVITDLSIQNHTTQMVGLGVGFIPTAPSSHAVVTGGYDFAMYAILSESGISDLQLAMLGEGGIDTPDMFRSELGLAYLRGDQSAFSMSISDDYYNLLNSFGDTMFEPDIVFDGSVHLFKTKVIQMYRIHDGVFSSIGRVYSNLTQRFSITHQELYELTELDGDYIPIMHRLEGQIGNAWGNIVQGSEFTNADQYDLNSAVYRGGQVMLARIN